MNKIEGSVTAAEILEFLRICEERYGPFMPLELRDFDKWKRGE